MNTPETQSGSSLQRMVRPCGCKYQKEKAWGYRIFRFIGGRKWWKPMAEAKTADGAKQLAAGLKTVLIVCCGCGADIVREYRPNTELSDRRANNP